MKNYRELKIWQNGIKIVKDVFKLTEQLPQSEKYGLISQMTCAAVSIPANIAEGSSRKSEKDYARFLHFSLGSAFELQTYLILIRELEWKVSNLEALELFLEEEIKMLFGFIKTLDK